MPRRIEKNLETIRFAVGESSIGHILVASSAKGVVSIQIRNDPEELALELQRRFPEARLIGGDKESLSHVKRVMAYVESPERGLKLPLDVRGTEFQKRVWQAVRKIPLGQASTYKDIAHKIGAPKAMRAVGTACGANKLALAIPCHRVLHSDGSICAGWATGRKRALLDREMEAV
jgi:AraC family transcriptional regulator of adaptative response/methylated-DNA-[protein]-cysteine methyltransferase